MQKQIQFKFSTRTALGKESGDLLLKTWMPTGRARFCVCVVRKSIKINVGYKKKYVKKQKGTSRRSRHSVCVCVCETGVKMVGREEENKKYEGICTCPTRKMCLKCKVSAFFLLKNKQSKEDNWWQHKNDSRSSLSLKISDKKHSCYIIQIIKYIYAHLDKLLPSNRLWIKFIIQHPLFPPPLPYKMIIEMWWFIVNTLWWQTLY